MFRTRTAGNVSAVDQPVRASRRQRRRGPTGFGFATGAGLLARVIHLIVTIVVVIIVAGILLVVLKANPTNSIVSQVHDWART
ncbi:MAG: hypothetical protein ACXVHK_31665, partial [Solirubrobacteraceae bacterium]